LTPTPSLSVVIATYDRWPLVDEAVRSVLAAGSEVEVVVSDDGSTDGTVDALRDAHPDLTIVTGPNAERGAARNRAVAATRGDHLLFLDSDDVLSPTFPDELRARTATNPPVVASQAVAWDPDTGVTSPLPGLALGGGIARAALVGMVVPLQGLVVRRDAFAAVGGFPEDRVLAGSEDWMLLLRLSRRYPIEVTELVAARIRQHAGRSMNDPSGIIASRDAALAHALADDALALDATERGLVIAGTHRFAAAHLYGAGDMAGARRRLRAVRAAVGPVAAAPLTARLWAQTFAGRRVRSIAARARAAARGER
jgi:hypothetical protein